MRDTGTVHLVFHRHTAPAFLVGVAHITLPRLGTRSLQLRLNRAATYRWFVALAWQDSLFADERPRLSFDGISRVQLDEHSWLDIVASWLPRHAELFELLHETAPWQQRERHMYDKRVLEPRLVAAWSGPELDALPDQLKQVREAVADRYHADFDSVLVNLYRDGRDGVAWHGDTVRKRLPEAVVVTVGLGERRRFLLRRGTSGAVVHELESGQGDLIVMGGRCQHDWQHTVPKSVRAGARMSVTMRHSAPLRCEDAQARPGDAGETE